VGAEYETLLGWMSAARDELKSREGEQSERANVWRQVLASGVLEMLRRGREDEAREMFEEIVSAQVGECLATEVAGNLCQAPASTCAHP
jgi:hypothetical protein